MTDTLPMPHSIGSITPGAREARISVAIMAHPKRREWAEHLGRQLRAPVVWDQIGSAWDTGRRALETADSTASHVLVVQDDAIVCRDLVAGLERAVAHAGQRPIGLYLGNRPHSKRVSLATKAATSRGRSWIGMDRGTIAGVASAHPVAMLDDLLAFEYKRDGRSYDSRTSEFYRHAGIAPWWTWPSLVEHRPGRSLMRDKSRKRVAVQFIGEDASALDVDWSLPPQIAP